MKIAQGVVLCASLAGMSGSFAQQPKTVLRLDATTPVEPAKPSSFIPGASRNPDRRVIGVTDRYLTMDGKPWLPVMGELHYSRVPAADWEEEILKMKAAGVNVISTYVFWIHHEEAQGEWDWSGQRSLRQFTALCKKHGMLVYPRLGPWAHGEARNGGLPDWVLKAGPIRQLDPVFMAETGVLYKQIASQLEGLLWKDGGPVIGVQLDNEYVEHGAGKGEAYILALKKMAMADGLDVPLYTVTGWGGAAAPKGEVMAVYGGYPDAPWSDELTPLPPAEVYAFRFASRESGNMGLIGAGKDKPQQAVPAVVGTVPFLTAEVGGGMQSTYHRRVLVDENDITAMMPVLLGSGVNGYGTYMFHGGQNPDGKLTTLQESQATNYPTDLPIKSYDFQSPIGEFGLERPWLRTLKVWNYFLNDFGSLLAPMPPFQPAVLPSGPEDLRAVRWSVRTDGRAGFLFLNNHIRESAMPARPQVQFSINLPGGVTRTIPDAPVDIPSDAYFAWPFGLDLDGVRLRYATAQLVMRLGDPGGETFVFACVRGVRCEAALEGVGTGLTPGVNVHVDRREGLTILTKIGNTSVLQPAAQIQTAEGKKVSVLLLSPDQAKNVRRVSLDGTTRLVETAADVFAENGTVTLRQLADPVFSFAVFPAVDGVPKASAPLQPAGGGRYTAHLPVVSPGLTVKVLRAAGLAPAIHSGPPPSWRKTGVAQLPDDAVWRDVAAQWSIAVKQAGLTPGVSDLFLKIDYTGDGARLRSGGKLLADDFYDGEPWLVGLRRYAAGGRVPPLALEILPFRRDAPVYLPPSAQGRVAVMGQTMQLRGLTIVPQYQLRLGAQ